MRFAFVTTEFLTTLPDGGGLASYVARMSQILVAAGHEVEIFVPIGANYAHLPREMGWNGCRLHHVRSARSVFSRLSGRALRLAGRSHIAMRDYFRAQASAVARALAEADRRAPFNVVHSADHHGIGRAIAAKPGRLHVVRCSAPIALYMEYDGRQKDPLARMQITLEETAVANADFAFAPSRLTAEYYSRKLGRDVAVIPSPIYQDSGPEALTNPALPSDLPERYLLHFAGRLIPRKGTDLIAEALPLALAEAPDLTMIWVGRLQPEAEVRLRTRLGPAAERLRILPPQDKGVLYRLIRNATCTVLPSLIDNLPNTVLESLMLGTPVIGSTGSSIDELVEHGVSGLLVKNGSVPELADAMVRAWTGRMGLASGPCWAESPIGRQFQPDAALAAYLEAISAASVHSRASAA